MRVVNMAHGSFYLLGGYIAYEVQQGMAGQGFSIDSAHVSTWDWLVPLAVAAPCIAIVGLVVQQAFLRWNQGQEMRQALITIAISVIIADQIIAHFPRNVSGTQRFGGNAVDLTWPGWTDQFVNLHVGGVSYSLARLVVLAIGVAVGVGLWLWLYRTRTGMVIRAGVDDQKMTSALGINIHRTFAVAFVVGSALAALGATVWASQSNISSGQDGQWLLNSLVVVIVGGMGSIFGAAAGALLYAFVSNFGASYLPTTGTDCCTQYSSILTFVLIALVLSFRPRGLFGRAG
jgi:branched-chain amino acid transport system permease protein